MVNLLWTDRCTIAEQRTVTLANGAAGMEEVVVASDLPCRLSFSQLTASRFNPVRYGLSRRQGVSRETAGAALTQTVKLFLAPKPVVKPGSRVTVTRDGAEYRYKCAGIPGVYSDHQEIVLESWEDYA